MDPRPSSAYRNRLAMGREMENLLVLLETSLYLPATCQDPPGPLGHGDRSNSCRNFSSGNFTVQIMSCTERPFTTPPSPSSQASYGTIVGMNSPTSQPSSHLNVTIRGWKSHGFQVSQAPEHQYCTPI